MIHPASFLQIPLLAAVHNRTEASLAAHLKDLYRILRKLCPTVSQKNFPFSSQTEGSENQRQRFMETIPLLCLKGNT